VVPFDKLAEVFETMLKPSQPRTVQTAALELLGRTGTDDAPAVLLKAWPSMSPQVRATATEVFLSRSGWVHAFLDAVEAKTIARGDVDPARIALLRKSPNRSIRLRTEDVFKGTGPGQREEVVERYQKSLTLKGDATNGKAIFRKECGACHKLDGVGEEIGADLKAIRDRGAANVLLNILDPNREVKPQFLAYALETTDGKTITGMITAETPNSVTIRRLDGTTATVARANIEGLRSSGLSFMPEGLEKQIDLQTMADLLAYLNSVK
jgi:putative heme-binding domain-containing protein